MNLKTTIAGCAAAAGALAHMVTALMHGDTSTLATDLPLVILGIGHIFAADA